MITIYGYVDGHTAYDEEGNEYHLSGIYRKSKPTYLLLHYNEKYKGYEIIEKFNYELA